MSLEIMASASNEKKLQRIMILRRNFLEGKCYTVEAASQLMGLSTATIVKYAKEGNIPLYHKGAPVVPVTKYNAPF